MLNFACIMAVCTGFGKPYSISYVSLIGVAVLVLCAFKYKDAYECVERLVWLTGSLVLIIEYLINAYFYGYKKKEE
jgi:hypothetical protein